MDFKVSEVIDKRNCAGNIRDREFDDVAIQAFRRSCLVFHHFPGARVSVFGGEEVGHSAAEHSHQGTTVGEVQSKSFLAAHSVS